MCPEKVIIDRKEFSRIDLFSKMECVIFMNVTIFGENYRVL